MSSNGSDEYGTGGTSLLGNAVPRREDLNLLKGKGGYVANVPMEGALHAHFVRSNVSHGEIISVETSEAEKMPGVFAIYTAENLDLADRAVILNAYEAEMTRPYLAREKVRFVGEPVAVVLAENEYLAADAAENIWVDIEPLSALVDLEEAVAGEVLLFPNLDSNIVTEIPRRKPIDFSDCEVVVEAEIINSKVAAVSIEPRVTLASFENGRLTCWASNQGAHDYRDSVAQALEMEIKDVRVIITDIGGGFGAKGLASEEEIIIAHLSRMHEKPVRWMESRTENLTGFAHGRAQKQKVKMGGSLNGEITHYSLEVIQDSGAYPKWGAVLPGSTLMMASGVYRIPNVEFSSRSVATTTAPVCAYRGAGRPEATSVIERTVDLFAREIAMDPAEVRRLNFPSPDEFPFKNSTGTVYDSGDYEKALDEALGAIDYEALRNEQSRRREENERLQLGIGISTYVEVTAGGGGSEFGLVELKDDGTFRATTGSTPIGTGHITTWAMLVADRLGVPMEKVEVIYGDTDVVPSGEMTGGSRSVQVSGSSMADASEKLVDAARKVVADLLEASEEDIVLNKESGNFHVVGTPAVSVSWGELASSPKADQKQLIGKSDFLQEGATFPFGAHIVIAEVDIETGEAKIKRIVAVDDAGKIVNPLLATGQVHGGLAQGVAQALLEEVLYDNDGNPQTANLMDYTAISAMEVPSFDRISMETPTPLNSVGAKGIGESGTIGSTAATQNAVVDAISYLGVDHLDMPLTPQKIWSAISDKSEVRA